MLWLGLGAFIVAWLLFLLGRMLERVEERGKNGPPEDVRDVLDSRGEMYPEVEDELNGDGTE